MDGCLGLLDGCLGWLDGGLGRPDGRAVVVAWGLRRRVGRCVCGLVGSWCEVHDFALGHDSWSAI